MATGDLMWQCPFCLRTCYTINSCSCSCEGWKRTFNKPFSVPCPDVITSNKNGNGPPTIIETTSAMITGSSCPVCGENMVSIRGKYPNSPERIVCPTCLADKIDIISKLIDPDCGHADQEKE